MPEKNPDLNAILNEMEDNLKNASVGSLFDVLSFLQNYFHFSKRAKKMLEQANPNIVPTLHNIRYFALSKEDSIQLYNLTTADHICFKRIYDFLLKLPKFKAFFQRSLEP